MGLKGLLVGDLHLCDYTPLKRTDNFLEAQFFKLEKIRTIAEEMDVDTVFLLGDVFDKARPDLWLINKVASTFGRFPCAIYSLIGNHDLQGCRDGLNGTALGNLFTSGTIRRLETCTILDVPIKAIHHGKEQSAKLYASETPCIIFAHLMATPQVAPFEHIFVDDVLKVARDCFIFSGDFHFPFERYNSATNSRLVNPGIINRTSIAEKDVDPSVIYFEASPSNLVTHYHKISLGAARGDVVFNVLLHEQLKNKELNLKQFIDSIAQTQFESQDIEKLVMEVGKENKVSDVIVTEAINRIKVAKTLI